jgi:hypothetical protein
MRTWKVQFPRLADGAPEATIGQQRYCQGPSMAQ